MTTIIGVDFSGAKADNKTWIAWGSLPVDGALQLNGAENISRAKLYELLENIPAPAVAAMDFPFGVPKSFAARLCAGHAPTSMSDAWQAIANMSQEYFIAARNQFVADYKDAPGSGVAPLPVRTLYCCSGEPQRVGDAKYLSGPFSPLHNATPSMPPMTYHGARLLQSWHNKTASGRWHVPPMEATASPEHTVTLLETMPGAFLQICGLPSRRYKGTSISNRMMRGNILEGLPPRSGWSDLDLSVVRANCIRNDDCLDAVVAFVCAASWARCQDHFHHPTDDELADARLEGWIYVPKSICTHRSAG